VHLILGCEFSAKKWLENALPFFLWDAWTVVLDAYADRGCSTQRCPLRADANASMPVFSVFHGVFKEIAQRVHQRLPVSPDYRQVGSNSFLECDALLCQRLWSVRQALFEQR